MLIKTCNNVMCERHCVVIGVLNSVKSTMLILTVTHKLHFFSSFFLSRTHFACVHFLLVFINKTTIPFKIIIALTLVNTIFYVYNCFFQITKKKKNEFTNLIGKFFGHLKTQRTFHQCIRRVIAIYSMMEFLRANSIWDSILLLLPFYTFRFVVVILRCLRFVSSIHVVSECDWMSDCFTIPNVCIYILQTRRALQQQKLNFRRCTSFFPAFYTLFTLFSSFYYIWFFFFHWMCWFRICFFF